MRPLLLWFPLALLQGERPPTPSAPEILAAWLEAPALAGLEVGVALAWADSGERLASHRAEELRVPASAAKLLTTASALLHWPAGHAWRTELRAEIAPDGTVRHLALVGHGDPRLVPEDLAELAKALRGRGARRVEGGIEVVGVGFGGSALPPGFEKKESDAGYRPLVGAAAAAFGAVTVTVTPGKTVGEKPRVRVDPATEYVATDNRAATLEAGAPPTLELRAEATGEGRMRLEVTGGLGVAGKPVVQRKRVAHPHLFTGWLLQAALEKAGARVAGGIREVASAPAVPVVVVHQGRPIESLVGDVNTWSNNFMAEMLFHQLGGPEPCDWGRAAASVERELTSLGLEPSGLQVVNGSGLYAATRVSAGNLARLLVAMARHPQRAAAFEASLAVGGKTGTLAHRLRHRATRGRVHAKTGTLDQAWALAGYLTTASGRKLAFAVLVEGGDPGRTRAIEGAIDKLVRSLAELGARSPSRRTTRPPAAPRKR